MSRSWETGEMRTRFINPGEQAFEILARSRRAAAAPTLWQSYTREALFLAHFLQRLLLSQDVCLASRGKSYAHGLKAMYHSRTPLLQLLRSAPLGRAFQLVPGRALMLVSCRKATPHGAEMQRRGTCADFVSTHAHPDIRGVQLLHPLTC